MALVPEEETGEAFCMRAADGDAELYLKYLDLPLSQVYRIYVHQIRLIREQHRP